ncbi:MAG: hypothetical protein SWK76_11945 [Actinomycetota bacterium]|nr:hypothetical protein [Actinomycetota bacterium]
MPDKEGDSRETDNTLTERERRKRAMVAARRAQLAKIAPVLESLPWRRITAGYDRLKDIETFIKFYEMYAPLLEERKDILIEARDSGRYRWFDLHATADGLEVTGIDELGNRKVLFRIRKHYWDGEYSPTSPTFTPL